MGRFYSRHEGYTALQNGLNYTLSDILTAYSDDRDINRTCTKCSGRLKFRPTVH